MPGILGIFLSSKGQYPVKGQPFRQLMWAASPRWCCSAG